MAGCPQSIPAGLSGIAASGVDKESIRLLVRDKGTLNSLPVDWISLRQGVLPRSASPLRYMPEALSARSFFVDFTNPWWERREILPSDIMVSSDFAGGEKLSAADLRTWARENECRPNRFWEIEHHGFSSSGGRSRRFSYLVPCPSGVRAGVLSPGVMFDAGRLVAEGSRYRYQMSRRNQMLFDRLEVGSVMGVKESFLEEGNFDIRADFRNFFNLHFTADNVVSKVKASHSGDASAVARLSFDLKLLFLNLDLRLNTDVIFFDSGAFLPMIMKVPRDAWRYVNPGSGVLYSWYPSGGTMFLPRWASIPSRSVVKSRAQLRDLATSVAKKHCIPDGRCRFRAAIGRGADKPVVAMDVVVSRAMVEAGFFPQYVEDARSEAKEFGWTWDKQDKPLQRQGLYFELSGLGRGQHGFDIWLRLLPAQSDPSAIAVCPAQLMVREVGISSH